MTRPIVELRGLYKHFPGVQALSDVSFVLRAGAIHGLVGENGAGKSTLINILSGTLQPDAGEVILDGQPVTRPNARAARRQGIVTVHQEVDLFADLSVAENMGHEQGLPTSRLGRIRWKLLHAQTRAAFAAIGVAMPPTALAGRLTPAQRQLVEIAAAVSQQARVLILDEPTSSLSGAETQILVEQLRRFRAQGTAILYVSHRLEEIFALADEVTVLRNGRHVATELVRDTSPKQLVRLMVGQALQSDEHDRMISADEPADADGKKRGDVRFACRELTAEDGSFADVTLEVRAGEVVGLYGLVGAGRSEWAQAVFGLRRIRDGVVAVDGRTLTPDGPATMIQHGLAYLPEDRLRQGLCRGLSVRANTVLASLRRLARWLWLPGAREVRQTRTAIDRLGVRLHDIAQPVGTLSGGNQQKVVLGRWLGCEPGVLLLDEPTRGVDVGAKAEIHGLVHGLAREGRAVVLISSDLPEVLSQSHRVGVFREGRLVQVFDARGVSAADVTAAAIPAGKHGLAPVLDDKRIADRSEQLHRRQLSAAFDWLRQGGLLAVVLILLAFQPGSWTTIARDTALLGFCALGAGIVIVAGGIDISIGALMALSTGLAGRLWEQGQPLPL
ncbi:MAG TPA: ATP-binding cassette domain-containing protein, partial [Gemmataceae bacterium]|nr:ATP-binding cassette domain-containing protein [Gemmataceae bacterium]